MINFTENNKKSKLKSNSTQKPFADNTCLIPAMIDSTNNFGIFKPRSFENNRLGISTENDFSI